VSRVTDEEFVQYMPELFVEPLRVDSVNHETIAAQWVKEIPEETQHVGIFTHRRELAEKLAKTHNGTLITGALSPEQRHELLQQARLCSSSLLVGTIDSLSEGISLSHIKAALVVEWTTELSSLLQFIGRFARADAKTNKPTKIDLVVGPNDVERLKTLQERVDAANSIFKAGRSESLLGNAVAERGLSDEEFINKTIALAAAVETGSKRRGLIDDDDD
jgi:superfamily II DNA or RNA helicase